MATRTFAGPREEIDPERWDRLKAILELALREKTARARTAVVRQSCGSDVVLLGEAESLLTAAEMLREEPTDWLEAGAEKATGTLWDDDLSRDGQRIGAYVVVRELGRGGMGAVYLAERADGEFQKRVAIKILKRGTDTEEILHRFKTERQIVAQLEHPNIVRLLDAGTTGDGLPYFVMEFVAGVPVTRFLYQKNLSIPARLELFLKICSAVAVAHKAGVVHRDLKPRNILMTTEGEPKLLDFGIAKLLAHEDPEDSTAAGRQHLTPQSASPEQVRGQEITLASDVYSLGALLYQMLTDALPHRFRESNPPREEVIRVVCEGEITPPSRVVPELETRRQLRGDLDNIVLHAMRKEPERRYPSVAEFSEDVRRHLHGEIVKARPATLAYRTQRFLARNRVVTTRSLAIAVILLALAGGLAALLIWGSKLRRSEATQAELTTVNSLPEKSIAVLPFQNLSGESENAFFASGVQDAILTDLTKIADLKVINRTSVQQYSSDKPRDLRQISRELKVAYVLEGSVQRANNRVRVSATLTDVRTNAQTWAESYDRDLADVFAIQNDIARQIAAQLRATLSPNEQRMGVTHDMAAYDFYLRAREIERDPVPGMAMIDRQVSLLNQALARDATFAPALCLLVRVHLKSYFLGFDRTPERLALAEESLKFVTRLAPDAGEVRLAEAIYQYWGLRNYPSALRMLTLARRSLPNDADVLFFVGLIERRLGDVQQSTAHIEQAATLDPYNPMVLLQLANNYYGLRNYEEATRILDGVLSWRHDDYAFEFARAMVDLSSRAELERLQKLIKDPKFKQTSPSQITRLRMDLALAQRDYEGARSELVGVPMNDSEGRSFITPRECLAGIIAHGLGNFPEAHSAFVKARAEQAQRVMESPESSEAAIVLAEIDSWLGDAAAAESEGERAVELVSSSADAMVGPEVRVRLAAIYARLGQNARALELLEQTAELPFGIDYGRMIFDEDWDGVRGEPRFEKILQSLAPNRITR